MNTAVFVTLAAAAGWGALTALVNTAFRFATPADVDAWAERNPKLAFVAACFRRAGFEPIALLELVRDFFSKNPAPPSFHLGAAAMGKRLRAPTPAPVSGMRGYSDARVAALCAGIALGLMAFSVACKLLTPAVSLAECEANVALQNPGLSFTDFVKTSIAQCGKDGSVLLVDILNSILESHDPALAPYQPAAREAIGTPEKMGALRAATGAK